jgi:putative hydrolase of the HAD superfamily
LLIIFDLDDTLIDTSGSITPVKMKRAFNEMLLAGLPINNYDKTLNILFEINEKCVSSKQTIEKFVNHLNVSKKYIDIASDVIYNSPLDMQVSVNEGAKKLLTHLNKDHDLAVVTYGKEEMQLLKMKKAGIDFSYFCKIVVTDKKDKGLHYQIIANEKKCDKENVFVCGDKIALDLIPAKKLGYRTIHIQKGRGQCQEKDFDHYIDYKIKSLNEIKKILHMEKK